MSDALTKKQRGFVEDYLETGNGVESALKNYDTDDYSTAGAIASENLKKPKIIEYLQSKSQRAAEIIFQIAESGENDSVRLNASKDILDRAGHKAVEKSISLNVNTNIADPRALEIAKKYEEELKKDL